ncbi:hypothetical protein JCM3765_001057 [Sporobolomyces pararoseus]
MKIPFVSTTSSSQSGSVLAIATLLVDKTKRSIAAKTDLSQLQVRLSRLAGNWAQKGTIDVGVDDADGDWLISRCQTGRMARLDRDGRCFCGTLADTESTICEGFDENDRRTVCVEDLRELNKITTVGETAKTWRRKVATCGLEFLDGFEPASCPVGFVRIGSDTEDEPGHFVCQDSASPHSCGPQQIDCYAQEGVLRTQCRDSACDPQMCKEGWRFRLIEVDDGSGEGTTTLASQCVRSKPLFFNSDTARS